MMSVTLDSLTQDERQLARMVIQGLTCAEIARRLGISQCAARKRLSSLYHWVGVSGREELAAWLLREQWRLPDEPTHDLPELTPEERDVARLLAMGLTIKAIAYRLGISESTVKRARGRALYRLGFRRTMELLCWVWHQTRLQRKAKQRTAASGNGRREAQRAERRAA